MEFAIERLADIREDLEPLLADHHSEIKSHQFELRPDWPRYQALESERALFVFTARHDGELVGYGIFTQFFHPHSTNWLVAQSDTLFLRPEYRRGRDGVKFIEYCGERLRENRVDETLWLVSESNDWGKILERMGYAKKETVYGKEN